MASASKPKRMHFRGSDGHRYRFLAKPQDDLRRDMRVMEYASLLNRLLADDADTCRRGMQARPAAAAAIHQLLYCNHWVTHTHTIARLLTQARTT